MRAILVGAVESSRIALERIAASGEWTCPLVLTLPAGKAGRHSDFVDLGPEAEKAGSRIRPIDSVNDPVVLELLREEKADAIFVIGWSQICGEAFRKAAGGTLIGYHPAPLPRLRGRAVIPWTILNREPISGGTLFWIDEGVDSGPILSQRFFHVAPDETAQSLYDKHMRALSAMMDEALGALASGRAPRTVQDERFATWAARRTPADGVVDWTSCAAEIARLVRAVGRPYPGARSFDGPHGMTLWACEVQGGASHSASPGQVVLSDGSGFSVMCGDGDLIRIVEWSHPEGRAPLRHSRLTSTPVLGRSGPARVPAQAVEARSA